jgi:IPTL-CTERM motif
VLKTDADSSGGVTPDDTVTYTINYSFDFGTVNATATLVDDYDEFLVDPITPINDANLGAVTDNGDTLTWSNSFTGGPGSVSGTITYDATVLQGSGSIINTATLTVTPVRGTPEVADAIASINITQQTAIPTLSEWGMIILSLLLAGAAIWMIRRRQTI